jgi:hypothetical protein
MSSESPEGSLENAGIAVELPLPSFFQQKKALGIFDENLCSTELELII